MKEVRAEGAGADRTAGWFWARDGNMTAYDAEQENRCFEGRNCLIQLGFLTALSKLSTSDGLGRLLH